MIYGCENWQNNKKRMSVLFKICFKCVGNALLLLAGVYGGLCMYIYYWLMWFVSGSIFMTLWHLVLLITFRCSQRRDWEKLYLHLGLLTRIIIPLLLTFSLPLFLDFFMCNIRSYSSYFCESAAFIFAKTRYYSDKSWRLFLTDTKQTLRTLVLLESQFSPKHILSVLETTHAFLEIA